MGPVALVMRKQLVHKDQRLAVAGCQGALGRECASRAQGSTLASVPRATVELLHNHRRATNGSHAHLSASQSGPAWPGC